MPQENQELLTRINDLTFARDIELKKNAMFFEHILYMGGKILELMQENKELRKQVETQNQKS